MFACVQLEKEKVSKGVEPAGPDAFDSNCITPGTPFMQRLGEHLRFFIRKKIAEDPAWQVPVIVFSGAACKSGPKLCMLNWKYVGQPFIDHGALPCTPAHSAAVALHHDDCASSTSRGLVRHADGGDDNSPLAGCRS
jgi:hypothetical protein